MSEIEKLQPAPTAKPVPEVSTEPLSDKFFGLRRNADWFVDEKQKCPAQESKWINLRFDDDGGVTIKR